MTTLKTLTVVAISLLLGTVTLQANEMHRSNMMQQLKKIKLTDEQKELLKTYGNNKLEERKNAKVKLLETPVMGDFVTVDGFDKEAFIHSAIGNAKHRITSKADSFEYTVSILTKEQRATLIAILKEEKSKL